MATRVDAEGLRPVARAIGLDPAAILKFLRGSKPRAALGVLVQDLPPGAREQALKEAITAFRAIYKRAKAPQPGWIVELEKGLSDAPPT